MIDPTTLIPVIAAIVIFVLVMYFIRTPETQSGISKISMPANMPSLDFIEDLRKVPYIERINLPEEKFVPKQYTRAELYAQAIKFSQEYAAKHPEKPYITADFINSLMALNNLPTLGKYAGNFFLNRKLFKPTDMFVNSNYVPSRRRRIQVYAYVGPLVSTAIN